MAHWSAYSWGWQVIYCNLEQGEPSKCGEQKTNGLQGLCKKCNEERGEEIRARCKYYNKVLKEKRQPEIDAII